MSLLEELVEWLRIPSISAGARDEAALTEAAEWAAAKVRRAGGTAELVPTPGGAPLVVGELRSARDERSGDEPAGRGRTPTVLIYGHYDVQDPGDRSEWTSPPFDPTIRDGRLYARGASDDKGNFWPTLYVACELAAAGELPVHVRVLVEGAEETGSDDVYQWVLADERGADAAIVFDSGMVDADTPALTLATRGMVFAHLEVRTGARPVHSGMYGGAALNAFHALHAALAAVLPGADGRLPEPLRAGLIPPAAEEVEGWTALPDGRTSLAEVGSRPSDATAEAEFWTRTGAEPSLDVNMVAGGEVRTIVPDVARAAVSVRLAAGQSSAQIAAALEGLLRDALPAGAELTFEYDGAEPSRFDPALPALQAARRALGDPALVRSGGTLPILAAFAQRGIPAIVGGYALPEDRIHSPDESYRLSSLEQGAEAARALYRELSRLK